MIIEVVIRDVVRVIYLIICFLGYLQCIFSNYSNQVVLQGAIARGVMSEKSGYRPVHFSAELVS